MTIEIYQLQCYILVALQPTVNGYWDFLGLRLKLSVGTLAIRVITKAIILITRTLFHRP